MPCKQTVIRQSVNKARASSLQINTVRQAADKQDRKCSHEFGIQGLSLGAQTNTDMDISEYRYNLCSRDLKSLLVNKSLLGTFTDAM